MSEQRNCDCLGGVYCDVTTCTHHTVNNACMAERIKVANPTASTSVETRCETFEPRAEG